MIWEAVFIMLSSVEPEPSVEDTREDLVFVLLLYHRLLSLLVSYFGFGLGHMTTKKNNQWKSKIQTREYWFIFCLCIISCILK